ncbi:MAG: hypothetical protein M1836_000808 [Candelina mexicana]|nr:MAG: hypothetical protein M1836_000808 [Candelina mexicana]
MPGFCFRWTGQGDGIIAYTSETKIAFAVSALSVLLTAGFLIGAIISLYKVNEASARLGMIGGFTVGFAISVGLLTNARRAEVFAATAAYAAVLVVFVSGNLGNAGLGGSGTTNPPV